MELRSEVSDKNYFEKVNGSDKEPFPESLLLRLQRRAQLVGECAEAGGRSIALRPLAHFLGLARFHDCLRTQADAPA